jgi:CRP-like cAMP-binding protein
MSDTAPTETVAELGRHPFFAGFPTEDLEKLAECVEGLVSFDDDAVVFRAGGKASSCYLMKEGEVALEVHSPGAGSRIIQTVARGEVLGWSWLFPPYRWAFDARVLTPAQALVIDGERLRECISTDHDLGYEVMTRFAGLIVERLQATRLQLLDLYASRT